MLSSFYVNCEIARLFLHNHLIFAFVFLIFFPSLCTSLSCLKIETCDNANCGTGKRCMMKKGFPKCVCAPNCKANKNQKANKIAVYQMPETRNMKRNEKRLTPIEMQNDEPTLIVANFNRRQSTKRTNQRANNNESPKALSYSHLISSSLDHQAPMSANISNETDHADMLGMKIRSGFFNDHTTKVTSTLPDGFYVGNLVRREI